MGQDGQVLGHALAQPHHEHRHGRARLRSGRRLSHGCSRHGWQGPPDLQLGESAKGIQAGRVAAQVPTPVHLHFQRQVEADTAAHRY